MGFNSVENEILIYEMFYQYLKDNGYTSDQDPDKYWEHMEDIFRLTFQQVIDEWSEEDDQ